MRQLVVLQERRRGQHHVGVPDGVGEDGVEDHREQVLALQPLHDAVLVGHGDDRVAVVDEEGHDGRGRDLAEQHAPQPVHVDEAGGRRRAPAGLVVDAEGAAVGHREAAAGPAELPGQRGQGEDGRDRAAAVAVPLQAPADADDRGIGGGVVLGQPGDVARGQPGDSRRPVERPGLGGLPHALVAGRVRGEEGVVHPAGVGEEPGDGQGQDHVGAGTHGQPLVDVGAGRGRAWIDEDDPRSGVPRTLEVRDEVDVRVPRVGAPHHDQARRLVVGERHARHLPGHRLGHRSRGRGANGAVQA